MYTRGQNVHKSYGDNLPLKYAVKSSTSENSGWFIIEAAVSLKSLPSIIYGNLFEPEDKFSFLSVYGAGALQTSASSVEFYAPCNVCPTMYAWQQDGVSIEHFSLLRYDSEHVWKLQMYVQGKY